MSTLTTIFLTAFICVSWFGPRYFGLTGLFATHVSIVFGYFILAGLSIAQGTFEFDGILTMYGLILQVFLINCLLLPIAITALWRRYRVLNKNRDGSISILDL
jgi:hypothetical protein